MSTGRSFKIAIYPGDGIGPEVMDQALRLLAALKPRLGGVVLETTVLPWGVASWEQTGLIAPADYLDQLRAFDAIYLGALGWPAKVPDHLTIEPIIRMRQSFDQYACVRPARLYPGVQSPLAGKGPAEIDILVIRENSQGEYVAAGGRVRRGTDEEVAVETAIHTRRGVERILRFGFDQARTRRRHLTMITKSNALKHGMVMWDEVLEHVKADYPDVTAERQHVDAAAMNFVRCPERFDVVVASNLFGDILTDLGGVIAGGLGTAPSANINPERVFPSMFEPVHGSAPDIAGRGIANPIAAFLSGAMLLEWLGLDRAARAVRQAVEQTLANGLTTPDLGGRLSTAQVADCVIERL